MMLVLPAVVTRIGSKIRDNANPIFSFLSLSLISIALLGGAALISVPIAIKGSYLLIGALLAEVLRKTSTPVTLTTDLDRFISISPVRATKACSILALCSYSLSMILDYRWILVLFLLVGYYLIISQLKNDRACSTTHLLLQLMFMFSILPFAKFAQTGFYFGNLDLLKHARFVEELMNFESTRMIPSLYSSFPGLHVLISNVTMFTELSINTSFHLTGLISYIFLGILVTFAFVRIVADTRLALYATFAVTLLYQFPYFSLYFFPQSVSILMILAALCFGTMGIYINSRRIILASLFISFTTVFMHHLSFIFIAPMVLFILAYPHISNVYRADTSLTDRFSRKGVKPLVITVLAAFSYWLLYTGEFIQRFVAFLGVLLSTDILDQGTDSGPVTSYYYGLEPEPESAFEAVMSLATVDGIYYITVACFLFVGIHAMLDKRTEFDVPLSYLVLSISSAVVILKTPLEIKSMMRIQLPLLFFFGITIGAGMRRAIERNPGTRLALAVVLVISLSITGPVLADDGLATADRMNQYHYSETEYQQIERVGEFSRQSERQKTSFWVLVNGLYSQGYNAQEKLDLNKAGVVRPGGHFIVNSDWSKYKSPVKIEGETEIYSANVYMSEKWLKESLSCSNKVYSNGGFDVTWSDDQSVFGCADATRSL